MTKFCTSSLLCNAVLRLPFSDNVCCFWSEELHPGEGLEVGTSPVTFQGRCCLFVVREQDTKMIQSMVRLLGSGW